MNLSTAFSSGIRGFFARQLGRTAARPQAGVRPAWHTSQPLSRVVPTAVVNSGECDRPAVLAPKTKVTSRPLRVVRFADAGQASALVGRMVISGRMADVCAELDRLAACEAALH